MTMLQDERFVCDAVHARRRRVRKFLDNLIATTPPDCPVEEILQTVLECTTAHYRCVAETTEVKRRLARLISRLASGERIEL